MVEVIVDRTWSWRSLYLWRLGPEIQNCLAVVEHMNQVLVILLAEWAGLSFPLLPKVEVCIVWQGVMHCIQNKLEVMYLRGLP